FLLRRNKESLLQGMHVRGGANRLGGALLPPVVNTAVAQSRPTHNLVKAFGTINGKPTSEDSEWDAANPYKGRDPRLHYTVIRNGTNWRTTASSTMKPVYTYVGEPNGQGYTGDPENGYWNTGYYNRKMLDSLYTGTSSSGLQRVWHLIRYAEVMLNYAE